jgi:hypothetical protein
LQLFYSVLGSFLPPGMGLKIHRPTKAGEFESRSRHTPVLVYSLLFRNCSQSAILFVHTYFFARCCQMPATVLTVNPCLLPIWSCV